MTYFDRAVKGDEDSITELLVNAMRPKFVRDAVLHFFGIADVDSVSWDDIRTQAVVSGYGRFDIIIEPPSADFIAIVEVKTRQETVLQDTQTTSYVHWLKGRATKVKKLIFLIPPSYRHRQDLTNIPDSESIDIRTVQWNELLAHLETLGLTGEPGTIGEAFRFISSAVIGSQYVLEFGKEEIALMNNYNDLEVALRTVHKLEDAIDSAANRISEACERIGVSEAHRVEKEKNPELGLGRYFGNYAVFVGLTFGLGEHADNIFSVVFQGFEKLAEHSEEKYIKIEECYYRKISKYVLANDDTTAKDAATRLADAVTEIIIEAGNDFQTIP